jgi:hypothetical protein
MSEFELVEWYASETAKRRFGSICQAVNEQGAEVALLGSKETPLLLLKDADAIEVEPGEVTIAIDDAKANWSAVTAAALFYGTQFRIVGKKRERAVLCRHPENRHGALRYRRAKRRELNSVIQRLEAVLDELRGLCERLNVSADLIARRFRDVWRASQGVPGMTQH